MIHHRQSLPLCFKAGNDLLGVHAWLYDLEGNHAAHRFPLLGHVDKTEPPFSHLLQELVVADDGAWAFGMMCWSMVAPGSGGGAAEEVASPRGET